MPPWLWLIILFLAVALLALFGIKGDATWQAFASSDTFADDLYGIIQLFVLEGRVLLPFGNTVPWPLQAAAFLAPVVTIFAFLQLVWTEVTTGVSTGFYRFIYRDHVVVFGMGERGRTFVLDALAQGQRVVAIDLDAQAAEQVPARFRKFRFIRADVLNPHLIARTGLARARAVVIFCGSGFTNLAVAQHVSRQLEALGKRPESWPRIICDATGSAQRDQIEADQLFNGASRPPIEFYSPEEVAARLLVTKYRPAEYAALFRRRQIHMLVYGDTQLAEAVVRQTAVLAQSADGERPRMTVIAAFSGERRADFENLAAQLAPVADVDLNEADGFRAGFWDDKFPGLAGTASQQVICLDTGSRNLELALRLQRETHAMVDANVPIFVGPLGTNLKQAETEQTPQQVPARLFANNLLTGFGDVPNVLGWRYVIDQQQDDLARRNHAHYMAQASTEAGTGGSINKPAALPWTKLPERFRLSNRSFVDHLPAKLALIDYRIVDGNAATRFAEAQIETLAKQEHNRWWAERLSMGWRYAETRDDKQRLHPDLVDWSALSTATRDYDIALVRKIPDLLADAGKAARPVCRVGVSGHRDATINSSNRTVVDAITAQLTDLGQAYPDHHFQVWSPLAEGADRLVADLAMQHLSASLHVPLPLPIEDYCDDFGRASDGNADQSIRQFQRLLNKAEQVYELPVMDDEDDPSTQRKWQYASAGAFILQNCHEVIFIWDGKPADGFGGTGQVAEWQETGHVPGRLRWNLAGDGKLAKARHVPFVRDATQ